jgi:predicted ABC-type ATPase
MADNHPILTVIGGINGSGKSTFATALLKATGIRFLNADLIAGGLDPFQTERAQIKAGRLLLTAIEDTLALRESFALESTLSGLGFVKVIREAKKLGYAVHLYYLELSNAELAIARVKQRVREGGHDIKPSIIKRRFLKSRENFENAYKPLADVWTVYNTDEIWPRFVAGQNNSIIEQAFKIAARQAVLRAAMVGDFPVVVE